MFGPWWARKTAAASRDQRAKLTQLGLNQRRPPTKVPSSSKPPPVRAARVVAKCRTRGSRPLFASSAVQSGERPAMSRDRSVYRFASCDGCAGIADDPRAWGVPLAWRPTRRLVQALGQAAAAYRIVEKEHWRRVKGLFKSLNERPKRSARSGAEGDCI